MLTVYLNEEIILKDIINVDYQAEHVVNFLSKQHKGLDIFIACLGVTFIKTS